MFLNSLDLALFSLFQMENFTTKLEEDETHSQTSQLEEEQLYGGKNKI